MTTIQQWSDASNKFESEIQKGRQNRRPFLLHFLAAQGKSDYECAAIVFAAPELQSEDFVGGED